MLKRTKKGKRISCLFVPSPVYICQYFYRRHKTGQEKTKSWSIGRSVGRSDGWLIYWAESWSAWLVGWLVGMLGGNWVTLSKEVFAHGLDELWQLGPGGGETEVRRTTRGRPHTKLAQRTLRLTDFAQAAVSPHGKEDNLDVLMVSVLGKGGVTWLLLCAARSKSFWMWHVEVGGSVFDMEVWWPQYSLLLIDIQQLETLISLPQGPKNTTTNASRRHKTEANTFLTGVRAVRVLVAH